MLDLGLAYVLIRERRGRLDTETWGGGHMMMEAETRAMGL